MLGMDNEGDDYDDEEEAEMDDQSEEVREKEREVASAVNQIDQRQKQAAAEEANKSFDWAQVLAQAREDPGTIKVNPIKQYFSFQHGVEDAKKSLAFALQPEVMTPFDILLFGSGDPKHAIRQFQKTNPGPSCVCAKTLNPGDVAWKCETCEKDPTCIICEACFEKGDHTGHRCSLKRNVGGCCDCGDPDGWDVAGFCSDHKGYTTEIGEKLRSELSDYMKSSAPQVIKCVAQAAKCAMLGLYNAQNLPSEEKK